jgi:hypothetical protein
MQFVALSLKSLENVWHIRLVKVWKNLAQGSFLGTVRDWYLGTLSTGASVRQIKIERPYSQMPILRACCLHLQVLRMLFRLFETSHQK